MTAFIKNAWYVACFSQELSSQPLARTLLGQRVVLFRTASRAPAALEDRCCHRMAPLSPGEVEPDGIRCGYHGMKFAPTGQCIEIPGQTQIDARMCVQDYLVHEQHGFVWIWLGDRAQASVSDIVDCHWHTDSQWQSTQGYIHYRANYQLIVDNLLDFSHLTFVHKTTLANNAFPNAQPAIEPFDQGIRLTREIRDVQPSPLHQMAGKFEGRVNFWNRQAWWLPSVFENWAGSVEASTPGPAHEQPGAFQLRHFSLLTPETEHTTHYFWIQPCQFPRPDDTLIGKVKKGIDTAFEEDRQMIEAQQQNIHDNPEAPMRGIAADKALNMIRMMIKRRLQHEAEALNP
jgi:phenylpropionate dioxygenase-like ring-hydroxylating dioxygenase large terminal subunit